MMSHLTWVRGLKLGFLGRYGRHGTSHLTWVRGLKHEHRAEYHQRIGVAPYVGAWIETTLAAALWH